MANSGQLAHTSLQNGWSLIIHRLHGLTISVPHHFVAALEGIVVAAFAIGLAMGILLRKCVVEMIAKFSKPPKF